MKYLIEFPEGREYFPEFLPTDNFYSGIYIAPEHIKAWSGEFHTLTMAEMSLIEEMAELTKAISKYYRNIGSTKMDDCMNAIKEEMAHTLISLKGLAWYIDDFKPEDIQAEIEKKWPAAYSKEKTDE